MPGPKYVDKFEFPSSFGFSGSAGDRTTVPVRQHERQKPQRFAKGGGVKRLAKVGAAVGAGAAILEAKRRANERRERERLSVGETLRGGIRERREKELGLKKGGKVKANKGGMHQMPGGMMKNSKMENC